MTQAGLRASDGMQRPWTLIAVAVRIAQGMGLHSDCARFSSPLQRELGRRLWRGIILLDVHAALDGASPPIVAIEATKTVPPRCVDDAWIGTMTETVADQVGITDMTFSAMANEVAVCMMQLTFGSRNMETSSIRKKQLWAEREDMVKHCEDQIRTKYLQHCSMNDPFQRYTMLMGEKMFATLTLMVRRPIHSFTSVGNHPEDDFDILQVATDVLEHSLMKVADPSLAPWSWWAWVKWYSLAVVLVELCSTPDVKQAERAWIVAEHSYSKFAMLIGESPIWPYMERLMKKAHLVRSHLEIPNRDANDKGPGLMQGKRQDGLGPQNARIHQSHVSDCETSEQTQQFCPMPDINAFDDRQWIYDESEATAWQNWERFAQELEGRSMPYPMPVSGWPVL